ncbi:MAG: T9SS type A sorting domain-containing protein [Fluviicola sp.]|nr:T9SS type A sorting domain-containing protein [Fluviicola sp.]
MSQYSDTTTCFVGLDTLSYTVSYNQQQCTDSCDGSYSIQVLIGSGSYSYQVTGSLGFSSMNMLEDSLCPDAFTCIANDLVTGVSCTSYFSVDTLQLINFSLVTSDESVAGVCDGDATLTISGGVSPYNITWFTSSPTAPILGENDSYIDSLCAGNYYYSITDASPGCCDTCSAGTGIGNSSGLQAFGIGGGLSIQIDNITQESCPFSCLTAGPSAYGPGSGTGSVQLSASDGTGSYTFSIDGQTNNSGFFILCPGTYTASVTDSNGNTAYTTFIMYEFLPYFGFPTLSSTNESCENSCDGTITINNPIAAVGMEYHLLGPGGVEIITYPETVFSNLCPEAGLYLVFGQYSTFCGTFYIGEVLITPGQSPTISSITSSPSSAPSMSDGCITSVVATGGSGAYSYTVDGVSVPSIPACGFLTGTYQVCVLDVNSCSGCDSIFIDASLSIVVDTLINEFCPFSCLTAGPPAGVDYGSGFVQLSAGAMSNYTYSVDGQTNSTGSFYLCPGTYTATVADTLGNTRSTSITIQPYIGYSLFPTVTSANETCLNSCDGSINVIGGSFGFMYELLDASGSVIASSSTGIFTNLCPGNYIVFANPGESGCSNIFIENVFIAPGQSPTISSVTSSPATSANSNDGCITSIIASGGTGAYSYTVDGVSVPSIPVCGLTPGEYQVCVSDNLGCSTCDSVEILQLLSTRVAEITDGCDDSCNSSVKIEGSGGIGPYVATIEDITIPGPTSSTIYTDTSWLFPSLCSGTYIITVSDNSGMVEVDTVTIITPSISTSVLSDYNGFGASCATMSDGEASVSSIFNDTTSLQGVLWSNGLSTDSISNLPAGEYIVSVSYSAVDSLLQPIVCSLSDTVIITSPDTLLATISNSNSPTASTTDCIGEITSNVSGAVGVIVYSWVDCNTNVVISTSPSIINLCPGEYLLYASDENSCSASTTCEIIQDVTGLDELIQLVWSVFPNPTNEKFTVFVDSSEKFDIRILTTSGKLVKMSTNVMNSISYNTKEMGLSEGTYFIELSIDGKKSIKRMVILY